jgi:TetR/AcrR family transcriptional regulator, transcriptional repressor for nem operon
MSPRPRKFDEEAVLWAALDAFRQEGYAGLSVARLEQATGLSTSSLYNAYGDKAGLHRRAIAHYNDAFMAPRLARHAGPDATLEDLEGLFTSMLEPPLDDGYGCLLINTATELGGHKIVPEVPAGLRRVAEHLDAVLCRELGSTDESAALLLMYQGLLVSIRAGLVTDAQRGAVHREFDRLRQIRDQHRTREEH